MKALCLQPMLRINLFPFVTSSLIIACYFFYPIWNHFQLSLLEKYIYSFLFLSIMSLLLSMVERFSQPSPNIKKEKPIDYIPILLYILLILLFLSSLGLQVFYMTKPILSGDDEAFHVRNQLWQCHLLFNTSRLDIVIYILICVLLVVSVSFLIKNLSTFKKIPHSKFFYQTCFYGVILLAILLAYFSQLQQIPLDWGAEKRWPPLGTLLGVLSFLSFERSELTARLPTLFFFLATLFVLYKTISFDTGSRQAGLLAVIVCLSSPIFFSYGHLAFRDIGGAFFIIFGIMSLLKFIKDDDEESLKYLVLAIVAGFLERRPVLVITAVFFVFILIHFLKNWNVLFKKKSNFRQLKYLLSLFSLILFCVFPWILATRNVRSYTFNIDNFSDTNLLLAYFGKLPEIFTWPMLFILLVGAGVVILRRTIGGLICLATTIILYIFFTGDEKYWIPVDRFTVLFVPPLAMISAYVMVLAKSQKTKNMMLGSAGLICALSLTGWAIDKPHLGLFSKETKTASSYPHYPFDQLISYFSQSNLPKGAIIFPAYWQPASMVYYQLFNIYGYHDIIPDWKPRGKRSISIKDLSELCDHNNCSAAVIRITTKNKNYVKVSSVENLTYQQITLNKIDGFNVQRIFFNGKNGLVMLTPSR